jgi:uncharacterized protein YecE (DUF72 family)
MTLAKKIYIGTSGWTYRHWLGPFYPEDINPRNLLSFYTRYFDTVELNASFYRLPSAQTFTNWYKKTPHQFIFAVKASRFITHLKKLKDVEKNWKEFINRASQLKEKLGPILFQLPPSFKKDITRCKDFFKILPSKYEYAFEVRHKSWFDKEVYALLAKHNISLVWTDSPSFPSEWVLTSSFIYLRFHGGKVLYGSNYSREELKSYAQKLRPFVKKGIKVYAYYNNDAQGYAVKNALTFSQILGVFKKETKEYQIEKDF